MYRVKLRLEGPLSMQWSKQEEVHLLNAIPSYRQRIKNIVLKEARRLTLELAEEIHKDYPEVQGRTVNAIYERLPYLDNLLAGVFEANHYAKKGQYLYGNLLRIDGGTEPNLCNMRHPYNGAMKDFRKKGDCFHDN
jgi:hypothetical protein